jgi:hypothetical protein
MRETIIDTDGHGTERWAGSDLLGTRADEERKVPSFLVVGTGWRRSGIQWAGVARGVVAGAEVLLLGHPSGRVARSAAAGARARALAESWRVA